MAALMDFLRKCKSQVLRRADPARKCAEELGDGFPLDRVSESQAEATTRPDLPIHRSEIETDVSKWRNVSGVRIFPSPPARPPRRARK